MSISEKKVDNYLITKLEPGDPAHQIRVAAARQHTSSWEWFGYLLTRSREAEWFEAYLDEQYHASSLWSLTPQTFAESLYDFLKGRT